jgi:tetratricopeptide (TPR) repeat protein
MRQLRLFTLVLVLAVPASQTRADNAADAYKLGAQANECLAKNQHADGLKLAEQAIRLDPKAPWFHGLAGAAHWSLKQYPAGLEECETAIRLAGGKADTWYFHMAGENAYSLLDFPLARKYFQQAIAGGETREPGGNFAVAKARLAALAEKTLAFEWLLQPDRAPALKRADGTFLIPIPQNGYPFQKVNKMTVTGAAEYHAEDFEGNEALSVKPRGDKPIRIQFRVTMTPFAADRQLIV